MNKLKIIGAYPSLAETARRLNMPPEEVEAVRELVAKVVKAHPDRSYSLNRSQRTADAARTRSRN